MEGEVPLEGKEEVDLPAAAVKSRIHLTTKQILDLLTLYLFRRQQW